MNAGTDLIAVINIHVVKIAIEIIPEDSNEENSLC